MYKMFFWMMLSLHMDGRGSLQFTKISSTQDTKRVEK
jgi:hypothetical protein